MSSFLDFGMNTAVKKFMLLFINSNSRIVSKAFFNLDLGYIICVLFPNVLGANLSYNVNI